jgi:hypothetical protein
MTEEARAGGEARAAATERTDSSAPRFSACFLNASHAGPFDAAAVTTTHPVALLGSKDADV